ncbi:Retrovirus-related Pol polyprotein from transposon opus [Dictyocoela muelleri]|nr:Retrovirus-related Pol polyprotein from transposon opus [Dictyocoela muelleri]
MHNIISEKRANELNLDIKDSEKIIHLKVANGESIVIGNMVSADIIFRPHDDVFKTEFLVAKNFVDDIILGMDFLISEEVDLIISEKCLKFKNFKISYSKTGNTSESLDNELAKKSMCFSAKSQLKEIITEFLLNMPKLGKFKNTFHQIKFISSDKEVNINSKPFRIPETQLYEAKKQIDELLKNNIIRQSNSNITSPAFFTPKKNAELRMVVDYRKLNNQTVKNYFPIPNLQEKLINLKGNKYFTR